MLAIIIPAFKSSYLNLALESLANQTNKSFNIYVGDDCSPEDLKPIVDLFNHRININYHRFENNIGAEHLVLQWKRCIDLTQNEEWIWLFSDDDIADPECVEIFHEAINSDNSNFDVYRFNTRVIDDEGSLIGEAPESPYIDSSENMAYEILMGRRGNSMPDHIFSRKIYTENNGIVYTDYAQAADWATSILFSFERGIKTLPGAKVNWRLGEKNISGNVVTNRNKKLRGHLQFLIWVYNFFKNKNTTRSKNEIIKAIYYNLKMIVLSHYKGLDLISFKDIYIFYRSINSSKLSSFIQSASFYFIISLNQVKNKIYLMREKIIQALPNSLKLRLSYFRRYLYSKI